MDWFLYDNGLRLERVNCHSYQGVVGTVIGTIWYIDWNETEANDIRIVAGHFDTVI